MVMTPQPPVTKKKRPTFKRLAEYFKTDDKTQTLQTKFEGFIESLKTQFKQMTAISTEQNLKDQNNMRSYQILLQTFEAPILTEDTAEIDYDDENNVSLTTNRILARMLGVTDYKQLPAKNLIAEIKEKLQAKGIKPAKPVVDNTLKSLQNYMSMRLFLGLQESVTLQAIEENIKENVENAKKRDEQLLKIASTASQPDAAKIIKSIKNKRFFLRGTFSDKQVDALKNKQLGPEIAPGAYALTDATGETYVAITQFTPKNIDATINTLKNNDIIHWHKVPTGSMFDDTRDTLAGTSLTKALPEGSLLKHMPVLKKFAGPNYKKMVETKCLQNWKRVTFDGKETALSKTLPKESGAWSEWLANVAKPRWKPSWQRSNLQKKIVRDVVDEDQNKLLGFWQNIVKNSFKPGAPQPGSVAKHLKKEQKELLEAAYQDQIKAQKDKINSLTTGVDQGLLKEQYSSKLDTMAGEYAECLHMKYGDIDNPQLLQKISAFTNGLGGLKDKIIGKITGAFDDIKEIAGLGSDREQQLARLEKKVKEMGRDELKNIDSVQGKKTKIEKILEELGIPKEQIEEISTDIAQKLQQETKKEREEKEFNKKEKERPEPRPE